MTIDALFETLEVDEILDAIVAWFVDQSIHLDGPRLDGETPGIARGVALVHAELVVVVVAGDLLERVEFVDVRIDNERALFRRRQWSLNRRLRRAGFKRQAR